MFVVYTSSTYMRPNKHPKEESLHILKGYADFVFFDQEVKSLGQPMRGPLGWYLPRLIRRTKPPARIPMEEATMRELVLDDYLTTELRNYAQELIKKSEVYGLEYP